MLLSYKGSVEKWPSRGVRPNKKRSLLSRVTTALWCSLGWRSARSFTRSAGVTVSTEGLCSSAVPRDCVYSSGVSRRLAPNR